MTQQDKIDLLNAIRNLLQTADNLLSWDTLPSRSSIQQAMKLTNTLAAHETALTHR